MNKKYVFFLMVLFCLQSLKAVVQVVETTNLSNLTLNECGDADTLTFEISSFAGTATNTNFTLTLPSYFLYVGDASSAGVVAGVNAVDPNKPIFALHDIPNGNTVIVKILVMAKCGANTGSATYINELEVTSSNGNATNTGANFVSGVKKPSLQLLALGQTNYDIPVGTTFTRSGKIQNTGVGSTMDTFVFYDIVEPGLTLVSFKVNGIAISPTINGDTLTITWTTPLREVGAFPGDTVRIDETFTLTECTDLVGATQSIIGAYWGCFDSPVCERREGAINVSTDVLLPNISFTASVKHSPCFGPGQQDTIFFKIKNTGGIARKFQMPWAMTRFNVDFFAYHSGYAGRSTMLVDSVNTKFKYEGGAYQLVEWDTSLRHSTTHTELGTPTIQYAGQIRIDSIPAGETVTIAMPTSTICYGDSSTYQHGSQILTSRQVKAEASFYDFCKKTIYYTPEVRPYGAYGDYHRFTPYGFGPTDMNEGDTGVFELQYIAGSHFNNSGDDSTRYLMLEVTIPTKKLVWDKDTSNILFLSADGDKFIPDSIDYDSVNGKMKIYWINKHSYRFNSIVRLGDRYTVGLKAVCANPGPSGATGPIMQLWKMNSTNCTPKCEYPLSGKTQALTTLHCPSPCPRGGVAPRSYVLHRFGTYGLPDNNNDGRPDGASFNPDASRGRVYEGDTIEGIMAGRIHVGPQSPVHQSPSKPFIYGYSSTEFPSNAHKLGVINAKVEYLDISTNTTYTYTVQSTSTVGSGGSGDSIYGWDWSVAANPGVFPPGFTFDNLDSVTVKSYWRVIQNPGGGIFLNVVDNEFYVSHLTLPPTDDSAKYRCDDYSGQIELIGYYITMSQPSPLTFTSCAQRVQQLRYYFNNGPNVGYAGDNWMQNEYRARHIVDTIFVELPIGLILDSAYLQFSHTAGDRTAYNQYIRNVLPDKILPPTNSAKYQSQLVYYVNQYYQSNGGTILESDEGYIVSINMYTKPSCKLEGTHNIHTGGLHKRLYDGDYNYPIYRESYQQLLSFDPPQLQMTNTGTITVFGTDRAASWDVKIKNTSATTNAENAWLGAKSSSGFMFLDSVRHIGPDTLLDGNNGVFEIGELAKLVGESNLKVYAHYNSCNIDTMYLYSGWDCAGYPANVDAHPCSLDSVPLIIFPLYPELQTSWISLPTDPRLLCDTMEYIASVSQRQFTASFANEFDILEPSPGTLSIFDAQVRYPGSDVSAPWVNITGVNVSPGVIRYYVSDTLGAALINGLRSYPVEIPNHEYYIRFKSQTKCGFISGSPITISARGTAPCGQRLADVSEFDPITMKNAPAPKLIPIKLDLGIDTLRGCGINEKIDITMKNFSGLTTTANDKFVLQLPKGMEYVPSSTSFSRLPFPNSEPEIDTVFNAQRLTWRAGTSIPHNDSSIFALNVRNRPGLPNDCGSTQIIAYTATEFIDTCVTDNSACNSTSQNAVDTALIEVIKPFIVPLGGILKLVSDTSTAAFPRPDSLFYTLTNMNDGLDSTYGLHIKFFTDANGNDSFDVGEVIYDSHIVPSLLLAGETKTVIGALSDAPGTFDPTMSIGTMIISPCDCGGDTLIVPQSVVPFNYEPLPVDWIYFEANYIGSNKVKLDWATALEENGSEYFIERSFNSVDFKIIGKQKSKGLFEGYNYEYIDNVNGLNVTTLYYRITVMNKDGSISKTKVKEVILLSYTSKIRKLSLFPNPTKNNITVELNVWNVDDKAIISIVDLTGKVVLKTSMKQINKTIDISALNQGLYLVKVSIGDETYTRRVTLIK